MQWHEKIAEGSARIGRVLEKGPNMAISRIFHIGMPSEYYRRPRKKPPIDIATHKVSVYILGYGATATNRTRRLDLGIDLSRMVMATATASCTCRRPRAKALAECWATASVERPVDREWQAQSTAQSP
jgi:hypothetical protein